MSTPERPTPPIIIEGKETELKDVHRTVQSMIDQYKQPKEQVDDEKIYLNEEELDHLKKWYIEKVKKIVHRKIKQNKLTNQPKKPEGAFISSVLSNTIGQLEILLEQTLRAKEEGEKRINPELLGKYETYKQLTELKKNLTPNEKILFVTIDLDDFKQINDRFGHEVGDDVLRSFGVALQKALRPDDAASHYSGDEFGFMFTIPQDMDAQDVLKRIIINIQKETHRPNANTQNINTKTTQEASVGFVEIFANNTRSFKDIRGAADAGAEASKIKRILAELKGEDITSADRIMSSTEIEEQEEQFSKKERDTARAIRDMKRSLIILHPDMDHHTLTEKIKLFLETLDQP